MTCVKRTWLFMRFFSMIILMEHRENASRYFIPVGYEGRSNIFKCIVGNYKTVVLSLVYMNTLRLQPFTWRSCVVRCVTLHLEVNKIPFVYLSYIHQKNIRIKINSLWFYWMVKRYDCFNVDEDRNLKLYRFTSILHEIKKRTLCALSYVHALTST